jgi:hypothetical protein
MASRKRKCEICGKGRPDTEASCPVCGGARETLPDGRVFTGYSPTLIQGKNDPQSGRQGLIVAAPGATSETELSRSGEFSISVTGAHGIGEAGEPRVKKLLERRLQLDEASVDFKPGDNSRGEDGIVYSGGRPHTLQISMALGRGHVDWVAASEGTATASGSTEQVAEWIDETIRSKAKEADPPKTILALDGNHLGIVAGPALVSCYLGRFGSPSQRFGFAAVWLVGPTLERCLKLG